ncbi:hypothetical protein BGZ92_000796, partial [Podila epicladia]
MYTSSKIDCYRNGDHLLPIDIVIHVFMHLAQCPQDLLSCALTTRGWTRPALQELYRHPWTFLFTYQFDTEGRVTDKHGSMLLLRTLFQGCMDPSRTAFPYATFARSVNLKWVHDTFDFPEVDIQTLTGFRWTRNEAPKDYLIRHLLANRPYLTDFIHCHAPRLPRCLFAHMSNAAGTIFNEDTVTTISAANLGDGASINTESASNPDTGYTTQSVSSNVGTVGTEMEWVAFTQESGSDDLDYSAPDTSLLTTPPLLPVQQPIATAMPLAHPGPSIAAASSSAIIAADLHPVTILGLASEQPITSSSAEGHAQASFLQVLNAPSTTSQELDLFYQGIPSPILLASPSHNSSTPQGTYQGLPSPISLSSTSHNSTTSQGTHVANAVMEGSSDGHNSDEDLDPEEEEHLVEMVESAEAPGLSTSLSMATESTMPQLSESSSHHYPTQGHTNSHHSRANTSSSVGSSSSRLFLGAWPLTMSQTVSLVYVDLRYAIVSDVLIISLSKTCQRIQSLKVATHWQQFQHAYSVTDRALATLVEAQQGLNLLHVDNNREISQGHSLTETIEVLIKRHGSTLQTLVLKSHDFQNCNLAGLGKSCQNLVKFSAPGGTHLLRDEVVKLTEACKLTLEHLDFSNSDIETDCLMRILKGMSSPITAQGVLKALILLGMEDTLNQDTCLAIGEHGSGLDCFRLDILESEAKDVATMLSRSCAVNLRVLTLGCHDVHGDLANEILEQIAANCRNVELLDVNHWQFSAKAIEKVLEECEMLRYLNVSYTDIGESTGEVICKCLGEPIKDVSNLSVSETSATIFTPQANIALSESDLQTPGQATTITTVTNPLSMVTPMQHTVPNEIHHMEELNDAVDSEDEGFEERLRDSLVEDEERIEILRKRGADSKGMDDEADLDEDQDMSDLNMDTDTRCITTNFSSNGAKKQSQMGLFHHRPLNAMDLQTIMNLDLDEVGEVDLDMCLDLKRYHRNSSSFRDRESDDEELEDDDIDMDFEEHDHEEAEDEDEDMQEQPKQPKGKEVHVEYAEKGYGYSGLEVVSSVSHFSVYSSSYESCASSSSSSSSTSSSSSSCLQPHEAIANTLDHPKEAGPLLPPLPIPSRQDDEFATAVSSPHAEALDSLLAPTATTISPSLSSTGPNSTPADHATTTSTFIEEDSTLETPSIVTAPQDDGSLTIGTTNDLETTEPSQRDLSWTANSRLEQVNVECCSQLSFSTMTRIKILATAQQSKRLLQGQKKCRIWAENEHDMMMTRLAME